jgi:hypothetical protein
MFEELQFAALWHSVQPNCSATVSKSTQINTTDDGDAVLKNALDKGNSGEL